MNTIIATLTNGTITVELGNKSKRALARELKAQGVIISDRSVGRIVNKESASVFGFKLAYKIVAPVVLMLAAPQVKTLDAPVFKRRGRPAIKRVFRVNQEDSGFRINSVGNFKSMIEEIKKGNDTTEKLIAALPMVRPQAIREDIVRAVKRGFIAEIRL